MEENFSKKTHYSYEDLLEIMKVLRSENGCPWDREQDHSSIRFAAVEEAYELVEAIDHKDYKNISEELGDLLLQVVFHSQIGAEDGRFTMDDVVNGIASKLVYRHPHVFGSEEVENVDEVSVNWDALKLKEKAIQTVSQDLKQVPKALPATIRSRKVQKKAAKTGFEFESTGQVLGKLDEEVLELKEAVEKEDRLAIEEEFGDLLFTMVNLSRFLDLNPEIALTNALEKFITRFEGAEKCAKASHTELSEMTPSELDALWTAMKKH